MRLSMRLHLLGLPIIDTECALTSSRDPWSDALAAMDSGTGTSDGWTDYERASCAEAMADEHEDDED